MNLFLHFIKTQIIINDYKRAQRLETPADDFFYCCRLVLQEHFLRLQALDHSFNIWDNMGKKFQIDLLQVCYRIHTHN